MRVIVVAAAVVLHGSVPDSQPSPAQAAAAGELRLALKVWGGKSPHRSVSQAAEPPFSWAAVQPDTKIFYFCRPCERRLEEEGWEWGELCGAPGNCRGTGSVSGSGSGEVELQTSSDGEKLPTRKGKSDF